MASVKMPTAAELAKVGGELSMNLSDSDIAFFLETFAGNVAAYNLLEALPDHLPAVKYPRTPGYQPEGEENKYNAWYCKTEIKGAPDGKLAGKHVALKDNVCVAGVPMMNGASTLEGYVPDVDATIVTRILDAGGTDRRQGALRVLLLLGRQPHRRRRARSTIRARWATRPAARRRAAPPSWRPARSTWRSAATRAARSACPSAYCGIYGHEADPWPGALHRRHADRADPRSHRPDDRHRRRQRLLLEVLAGPDGLDPRQVGVQGRRLHQGAGQGRHGPAHRRRQGGLRPRQTPRRTSTTLVQQRRRSASRSWARRSRRSRSPCTSLGPAIWTPIAVEGATWQMMHGNGFGFNWKGLYVTSLLDAHAGWRDARRRAVRHAQDHDSVRPVHPQQAIAVTTTPRAQNLARKLKAAYDAVLGRVRSAADADPAVARHARFPSRRAPAHGHHQPRLRDARQHRAVRRHRPPGDVACPAA